MRELVVFAMLGLGSGALIAGNALALVLVHRGTGAINLATGAVAAFAAFVFYGLRSGGYLFSPFPFGPTRLDLGSPWATAPALIGTLGICVLLGLALSALLHRLRTSAPLAKLVASLGVLLLLQAIIQTRFGSGGQVAPTVLPQEGTVTVFGTPIPADRFMLSGGVVVVAVFLAIVYRFTRFGLATRAAAEDETSAMLTGLNPDRLSRVNVVAAVVLGGLLGVLVASISQLDPVALTESVVPALGAALLARFTSFGVACGAGLVMGALASIVTYLQTKPWFPTTGGVAWPGVPDVIYLLVIVIVLVLRGSRVPTRGTVAERKLPPAPAATRVGATAATVGVIGSVAVVLLPAELRQALIFTLIGGVACMALVVITGFAGQVSLAQLALAGGAGLILSKLAVHLGLGFPLGPIVAVGAAIVIGLMVATAALRVRGVQLAIVTLAAAVAIENFVFNNVGWGAGGNSSVPSPHLLGLDLGTGAGFPGWSGKVPSPVFGLACLVVAVVVGLLVAGLRRSALGQKMLAVRSNERAAAAMAIDVRATKLVAFGLSSAIAGLAGVLYSYNTGAVDTSEFGLLAGLGVVAYAYLGGITTVAGAAIGGMLAPAGLLSYFGTNAIGLPVDYQLFLYGLAVVLAVAFTPQGAALALRARIRAGRGGPLGSTHGGDVATPLQAGGPRTSPLTAGRRAR